MNKISDAITEIYRINSENERGTIINKVHPLSKLLLTILYIVIVVSFDKYDLKGISSMIIYPLISMILYDISIRNCFKRLRPVFIIVCAVGIVNPFLDRRVVCDLFGITITSGLISMLTLMLKGSFAVMASYILIITTSIEKICYSLRLLHVPKIIVSVILFIYRYNVVLLRETEKLINAYELRAPREKGIRFEVWGSLAGMLLLRSMDRAEEVYESMTLRGYNGEYYIKNEESYLIYSILYFTIWTGVIFLFRFIPIFEAVGRIFVR